MNVTQYPGDMPWYVCDIHICVIYICVMSYVIWHDMGLNDCAWLWCAWCRCDKVWCQCDKMSKWLYFIWLWYACDVRDMQWLEWCHMKVMLLCCQFDMGAWCKCNKVWFECEKNAQWGVMWMIWNGYGVMSYEKDVMWCDMRVIWVWCALCGRYMVWFDCDVIQSLNNLMLLWYECDVNLM